MTEVLWNRMTAETLRGRAAQGAIVLLPVASTEQHGPHLATGVDDYLCGEACRRAAMLVVKEKPIVVAPTLWCGLAEHHVAFGGTFTLTLPTYHALLRDLCQSILRAGFKHILIVNGHGGNITALNALTVDLTRELSAPIATTTYIITGQEETKAILEDQDGIMHACEGETSMMMALKPDLVDRKRLAEAHGPSLGIGGALSRPIHAWKSFKELTPSGVMGDARRSTPAKGEAILDACAKGLAERLLKGEPWG
jgi:creatinine amidohydrolase